MFCIHLCWSNLFSALAAGILSKLNHGLFLREFVQPNAAQVATMMTLWKMTTVFRSSSWNFLSLHYVTYFTRWILQISTVNVTLQVLFRGISWENIHFCGFLKKTYIANRRKIKVNSTKKYVKFLSSGYFFSSYISPLGIMHGSNWKIVNMLRLTPPQKSTTLIKKECKLRISAAS